MGKTSIGNYWKTIGGVARQKTSKKLGIFGRIASAIIGGLASGLLSYISGGNVINSIFLALIIILAWCVIWFVFFVVYLIREPALIHEKIQAQVDILEGQKIGLQDKVNEYERKVTAEAVTLDNGIWARGKSIRIRNGEKRHSFDGRLCITAIPELREHGHFWGRAGEMNVTSWHIPPADSEEIRIIDIGDSDIPSVDKDGTNRIYFEKSGEYTIITLLEGHFSNPETPIYPIRSKWKFIVDRENRKFDLVLTSERMD